MSEGFEKLKLNRKTVRTAVTKLVNTIDAILKNQNIDFDSLEENLNQLEIKSKILSDLEKELEPLIPLTEFENEKNTSYDYADKISSIIFRAKKKIRENGTSTRDISSTVQSTHTAVNENKIVKLPKLIIQKFSGDYTQYTSFINTFKVTIHENESLSKIEKFNYLKSYLTATALNAIEGLEISESNYDTAIAILENRFGNPSVIINHHMNKLLNLSPIYKSSDIFKLKKLHEEIEINTRALSALGVNENNYSAMLIAVILKILPNDLALDWNRKNASNLHGTNIQSLLEFLQTEIISRERTFGTKNAFEQNKNKSFQINRAKTNLKVPDTQSTKFNNSTYEFVATVENEKKCVFCLGNHYSELCKKFDVQKRKNILKEQGRCFLCLNTKHRISDCTRNIKCKYCGFKHSPTICYKFNNTLKKDKTTDSEAHNSEQKSEIVTAVSHIEKNKILLQTCSVKAKNKNKEMNIRLLLDTGSMKSFLLKSVFDSLKLKVIRQENLSVFTFGNKEPIKKTFDVVKLNLESKKFPNSKLEIEALVTDNITGSDIPPPEINDIRGIRNFQNLTLADSPQHEVPITLLIGADYYYDIVTGNLKHLNKNLIAIETIFGWCLQNKKCVNEHSLNFSVIIEENLISKQIEKFWDLESSGIINIKKDTDPSENEIMKQFEEQIQYENNRYKVKLPWKLEKQCLDDNRKIAEGRLVKLNKRFIRNPQLFFDYKEVLEDYLRQGIIEVVDNSEDEDSVKFYLPHREVIKLDRTTSKLRIVFDASSHEKNCLSLNDCLNSGPNLYPEIFNILMRFRMNPVAFTVDMKQAFLQIFVHEKDRDVSRFLFSENPLDISKEPLTFRFTRVLFGLNCSPFLLAATIKFHLKKFDIVYPATVEFLNENVYVDDIIGSHSSLDDALSVSLQSIEIFEKAGMQLHKWHTNCKQLHELWIKNDILPHGSEFFEENNSPNKVLGLGWNNLNDLIYFDSRDLINFVEKNLDTKRFVLQVLGRIYDPIGFLGPFTVRIKCLMQKIWSSGLDWDDTLPDDLKLLWKSWCKEVPLLSEISVPRFFFSEVPNFEVSDLQLHLFSDSSMKAFGTVAYFRITTSNQEIRTVFVASKNRVAPLKSLTLPRLELMGALLSAKLCNNILKALKTNMSCFFWTDSKIVYHWVKGLPEKFKPFVRNRIEEIRSLTDPLNWHHCPGDENPADLVSRGTKVANLLNDSIWLSGPKWLSLPSEFWPKFEDKEIDCNELEYTKKFKEISQNECVVNELKNPIEICKYSNLEKLLRITAWIKRFIKNLKNKNKNKGPLSAEEVIEAENFLILNEQKQYFKEEYEALRNKGEINKDSKLFEYMPYLDKNELMRLGGRLEYSDFSIDEKHPVFLPRDSWLTVLIVRRAHSKVMHGGTASTLSQVRSQFWVPKGRQLVKKVIKNCIVCQKYLARPADQLSAPLPSDRIHQTPVFTTCGLDFAGPLYVKNLGENKKSYILLFTCGVTRALHLELVSDMTTDSFLLAFRRFLARRGNCKVIYSDNAKTFQKGKKEIEKLSNILVNSKIQDYVCKEKIVWKNIVERSPWWGGFYERLVKSVKECLHKILGRALLSYEEMITVLTEIEAVLNLRPLSYVYDEHNEPRPLTPMHFLNFGQNLQTYPITFAQIIESASDKSALLKRKRYQMLLLKQLWQRWKQQYLFDLRTAHAVKNPNFHAEFKVGDVVLIQGDTKNKLLWKLGRVEKALPGRDKKVRCYELKTSGGIIRRTVQHMYPLELKKKKKKKTVST